MGSFAPMGMGSLPGMGKSLRLKPLLLKNKKAKTKKGRSGNPLLNELNKNEALNRKIILSNRLVLIKYRQLSLPLMIFLKLKHVCLEECDEKLYKQSLLSVRVLKA